MRGPALQLSPAAAGLRQQGLPEARDRWLTSILGLVIVSFVTAGLIARPVLPALPGGLNVDPADVILLGLVATFLVRGLMRGTLEIPGWPITGPLFLFVGFALFSGAYALLYERVSPGLVFGELRPALYCGACALAVTMLRDNRQLLWLIGGLFLVADLTAGVAVVQQFLGPGRLLVPVPPDGLWQVNATGSSGFGSVRLVPPGHVLVYLMANVAFCLLLLPSLAPRWRAFLLLQIGLLGLGMLLSFTRAQWIASGLALLLAALLLPLACKRNLAQYLLPAGAMAALAAGLLGSGLIRPDGGGGPSPLVMRAATILTPSETLDTSSLEWRAFEIDTVFQVLAERPVLGVGLGNDYRDVTLLHGEASGWLWDLGGTSRLTRFVHNGYLYLAVKMGYPALAAFLVFALSFLIGGIFVYLRIKDTMDKLIVLAAVSSFAGLLAWAMFQPHLMLAPGMAMVGIMAGIIAVAGSRLTGRTLAQDAVRAEPPNA